MESEQSSPANTSKFIISDFAHDYNNKMVEGLAGSTSSGAGEVGWAT